MRQKNFLKSLREKHIKKIPIIFLCLLILIFILLNSSSILLTNIVGKYVKKNANNISMTIVTDPSTVEDYKNFFTEKNGTRYDGRVWIDKSVLPNKEFTLDNETLNFTNNNNANFVTVFSALGSSQIVKSPDILDVMFVIDLSGSQGNLKNGQIAKDEIEFQETSIAKTVSILNNTVDKILKLNSNSRIGVSIYGATATVLLPLDNYSKAIFSTKFIEVYGKTQGVHYEFNANAQKKDGTVIEIYSDNSGRSGNDYYNKDESGNRENNGTSGHTEGNGTKEYPYHVGHLTNQQAGIASGLNNLANSKETTWISPTGQTRSNIPCMIHLTDGQASDIATLEGNSNWNNVNTDVDLAYTSKLDGFEEGSTIKYNPSQLTGNTSPQVVIFQTLMSASYYTTKVNKHYIAEAEKVKAENISRVSLTNYAIYSSDNKLEEMTDEKTRTTIQAICDPVNNFNDGNSSIYITGVNDGSNVDGAYELFKKWKAGEEVSVKQIDTSNTKYKININLIASQSQLEDDEYGITVDDVIKNINYINKGNFYTANTDTLSEKLANIIENENGKVTNPIGDDENESGVTNALSYVDPIGKYMDVINIEKVLLFGEEYDVVKGETKIEHLENGQESEKTYYNIDLKNGNIKDETLNPDYVNEVTFKLSEINIYVDKSKDYDSSWNEQSNGNFDEALNIEIPANALPMKTDTIELDANDKVVKYTDNFETIKPLRVVYTVGISDDIKTKDGIIDITQVSNEYFENNKEIIGNPPNERNYAYFYSNFFSKGTYSKEKINEESSISIGNAAVTFSPSAEDRFYYFQKNLTIYSSGTPGIIDEDGSVNEDDKITNLSQIEDDKEYYFVIDYYVPIKNSEDEIQGKHVECVIKRKGSDFKGPGDESYITYYNTEEKKEVDGPGENVIVTTKKGGKRIGTLQEMNSTKQSNNTKTADTYYVPSYHESNKTIISYLGNNGRIAIRDALMEITNTVEIPENIGLTEEDKINIKNENFDFDIKLTATNSKAFIEGNYNAISIKRNTKGSWEREFTKVTVSTDNQGYILDSKNEATKYYVGNSEEDKIVDLKTGKITVYEDETRKKSYELQIIDDLVVSSDYQTNSEFKVISLNFKDGQATVQLKDGEGILISGLQTGVKFEITEHDLANIRGEETKSQNDRGFWFKSVNSNDENDDIDQTKQVATGIIRPDETDKIDFVNEYAVINIPVTKIWNDGNDPIRPSSITIKAINQNNIVAEEIEITGTEKNGSVDIEDSTNKTEWKHIFRLSKYVINAEKEKEEARYTFEEIIPEEQKDKYEAGLFTGNQEEGFKIENTELINIPVEKIWKFEKEKQAEKIPDSITFTLSTNADVDIKGKETITLNGNKTVEDNQTSISWTGSFNNLPKYDKLGNEIQYTVIENTEDNKFYVQEGDAIKGKDGKLTFTNKLIVPDPKIETSLQKNGVENIKSKEDKVHYEIEYRATVENYEGKVKVTIVDHLPYPIDKNNSNLAEGKYNPDDQTITWEEIENIDTFTTGEAKEIVKTKIIELKYEYGNLSESDGKMTNVVNAKIELQEPTKENPEQYETVMEKEDRAEKETITQIPTEVLVHHYYEDTQTSISPDITIQGNVDDTYQTNPAEVPLNYKCTTPTPDKSSGTMEEEQIVVTYYYKLEDPILTSTIEKEGEASKVNEEGEPTLTTENGVVTYNIRYTVNVDKYIGKATIEIVDKLPAKIDTEVEGTDLQDGEYSEDNKTITWKQDITGIDTYTNEETGNIVIEKTIKVVYKNQNYSTDLINKVTGTAKLYYPDEHPDKGGRELKEDIQTAEETIKQEYKKDVTVEKIWEHGENEYGYPEEVELKLIKNGTQEVGRYTVNEGNGWKHTFTDLPKYDEDGNEIEYTADETESEDLIHYEKTIEGTKVINRYIGAIISQEKQAETEYGNAFVVKGERITYKVIVTNRGETEKEVTIKDSIPEGTTFEEGSIRVNGQEEYEGTNYSNKTEEDLTMAGIILTAPKVEGAEKGTVILSFDVIVNEDATGDISNIATVDNKETNKVELPIIEFEKIATVESKNPDKGLEENKVTVGDIINYTIKVRNTGTVNTGEIIIKDNVPEGTQVKEIRKGGIIKGEEITWIIDNIGIEETTEVGFKAEVEYIRKDGYKIENAATVNGETTNKTENPYVKAEPQIETTIEKNGTDRITSKEEKVHYEIEYRATVEDFNGRAKITIVDHLPYPIDKDNSNIAEGKYNPDDQTITWEEEIKNIDTFTTHQAREIILRKTIDIKYDYGSLNGTSGKMTNEVSTKIELQEPTKENPEQYETVKDKEDEAEKETLIEIPAEVLVHHYIYDEEKHEETTVKIVEDVLMRGLVGKDYQTEVAEVPDYYECINTKPEKNEGKYEENQIVVIYYYKLITPELNNNIEKTATANKVNSEGKAVLTKENGVVTYNIRYTVNVDKYIGKATIEIVDTLPAKLDLGADGIDLQRGVYNEENNTITWKEEIENVDIYEKGQTGSRNIVIEKTIKVVYKEQNLNSDLTNTVTGTTTLYYPDEYPDKGGQELKKDAQTAEETVKQEYLAKLIIEKEWDDSDNRKGRRPESVLVDIKEIPSNKVTTIELKEENGWRNEQNGLRKYDEATGEKITYEITEREKNPKDLEYYEEPQYRNVESQDEERTTYVYTIANKYKLKQTYLNTTLIKTGTEEIRTSKNIVEYTITFTVDITDYIGEGKVRIVDYLPYKININSSDLANGIYNDDAQTITWEESIEHINTDETEENKQINLTKTIRVLYKNIDLTQDKMTNNVTGKIELFENDTKDEKESAYETDINVNGKVIVRFVDKKTGEDIVNKVVDENGNIVREKYNYEIKGKVGDEYTANEKEIQNYNYVETEGEKTGKVKEGDTEIIHYYERNKAKVIVKYLEKGTDENLLEDEVINGQVFDEYTTEEKKIQNYKFVESTDNTKGEMTTEDIVVIYYYEKIPSKVTVKYVERTTETDEEGNEHEVLKELLPEDVIEGYAGDKYETERKEVKNYRLAKPEPENAKGNIQEEPTEVIYYYEKIPSGILNVKYVDIDTGKTIIKIEENEEIAKDNKDTYTVETYDYEITGYVGDEYETEQKEIPYYIYVKSTENTKGELTEEGDTVIYYYKKQEFNISINKYIENVTLNEENIRYNNNKFMKQEIVETAINSNNLKITYGIEVKNIGTIDGTAKIKDTIPEGFNIIWADENFTLIDNKNLEAKVILKAGESKVLKLTLNWIKNKDNFGEKTNTVSIIETSNIPGFEDINAEDNISEATILLAIKTGINNKVIIAISTFILLSIIIETVYLMKTRKITLADIKKEIIRLMSKK